MKIKKYLLFAYHLALSNLGLLKKPYKMFLVVTKSCQSRCINCQIWKEKPKNELSVAEYEQLARHVGKNLSWLNMAGGEPTDREDLIEIIKVFEKHCPNLLVFNFTSNGLNEARLIQVAQYLNQCSIPVVGLNISIDGPKEMHNKIRGREDFYELAVNSLKKLRKFKNIKTHASMTLFDSNHSLVQETFHELKSHIPDLSRKEFHILYSFQSKHYYNNDSLTSISPATSIDFPKENLSLLSWDFATIIKNLYNRKLLKYLANKKSPLPCSALKTNMYISEHGDLFPCTIWNNKIGSLREHQFDLTQLLESDKAMETRDLIVAKACPNCWSPCEAFPTILDNLKDALK